MSVVDVVKPKVDQENAQGDANIINQDQVKKTVADSSKKKVETDTKKKSVDKPKKPANQSKEL